MSADSVKFIVLSFIFTFFCLIQLRKVMIEIGDAFLKDRVIVVSILVLNFNFFAVDVLNFTM
jgi:hypothetical protein